MIYSFHLGRFFSYHSPYTLTYIVLSLSNLRFLCKSHTVLNSLLHIISFCDLVSSTLTGYVMVFSRPKKIIYKIDFSFFSLIFFLLKFIPSVIICFIIAHISLTIIIFSIPGILYIISSIFLYR